MSTRTSPSTMRGMKRMSTSMPLSPMMYWSQKSMKSPSSRISVWLSTASVHLSLVSSGRAVPGSTDAASSLSSSCTRQMPEPVEPRFCLSTRSP